MSFIDRDTNKKITTYLFVACLPYSQKIYVEETTSMNQESWMNCNVNMLNYFGGSPLTIVCDNCKTAVISHPRCGDIELNEEYLTFCEYYGIVVKPANVRKPKEKASIEGNVGKIATKIIAKLRNETFYSLNSLNNAILNELNIFNSAPFQKRNGSRNSIFEFEEKRYLKPLPRVPYEVSTWYYSLKVMYNSHISFRNNFYSVPYKYINKNVDVKIYNSNLYVYYKKELIASHTLILSNEKNKYITNKGHLDERKEFKKDTVDSLKKRGFTNWHLYI